MSGDINEIPQKIPVDPIAAALQYHPQNGLQLRPDSSFTGKHNVIREL